MNVKIVQIVLQNAITWTKKYEKGKEEWEKTCIDVGCIELKTFIRTKFVSKSLYLKRPWNSNMPSSHVMKGKGLYFYKKEFLRPKCGLLYR
jgi:hypothetical protein